MARRDRIAFGLRLFHFAMVAPAPCMKMRGRFGTLAAPVFLFSGPWWFADEDRWLSVRVYPGPPRRRTWILHRGARVAQRTRLCAHAGRRAKS